MSIRRSFTIAIAGATPVQFHDEGPGIGGAPIWPGVAVDTLVMRLAERALDHGWRLAFSLRSPFATLLAPLCQRRQRFRAPEDPASLIWYRQPELGLVDPRDRDLSEEEVHLNSVYAERFRATLECHSRLVLLHGERAAYDSLLGLADVPEGEPKPDAIVYIGGRPDEILSRDESPGGSRGSDYRAFVQEFEWASGEGPVFLVGACGGFARQLYAVESQSHIDRRLSDRNRLDPVENECLGKGLLSPRPAAPAEIRAASPWDVTRCVFRGLLRLAGAPGDRG